ncbi:MAG: M23 family metallopeptidase [Candidatus Glassbacteria bacterium]|nr:M23 family metallopeptidase [Candidatus Glassbacteria bacterium]
MSCLKRRPPGVPGWCRVCFGVRVVLLIALAVFIIDGCAGRVPRQKAAEKIVFDEPDRRLVWPLPIVSTARLTSRFGSRTDPLTARKDFHTGVDLDGEVGTPVHASGAGKVTFSGNRSGYGVLLTIDHGHGLTTYYAHCSELLVKTGDRVRRGQVVALMGKSGRVTGSHLHFETRKHGRPFDPFVLLPKLRAY